MIKKLSTAKLFAAAVVALSPVMTMAENVEWFDGQNAVTYNVQKKTEPVVKMALDMFCGDMEAVTGKRDEASRRKAAYTSTTHHTKAGTAGARGVFKVG